MPTQPLLFSGVFRPSSRARPRRASAQPLAQAFFFSSRPRLLDLDCPSRGTIARPPLLVIHACLCSAYLWRVSYMLMAEPLCRRKRNFIVHLHRGPPRAPWRLRFMRRLARQRLSRIRTGMLESSNGSIITLHLKFSAA